MSGTHRASPGIFALCNCYVAGLSNCERFCLRRGVHETTCPVYRPSGDPVDRMDDEQYRAEALQSRKGGAA